MLKAATLPTASDVDASAAVGADVRAWAEATTDRALSRRGDVVNDKSNVVGSFFAHSRKEPADVRAADVRAWQTKLEERGITASTVYIRTSLLSSFFRWAMANTPLGVGRSDNPVALARPKHPGPRPAERRQSLSAGELRPLLELLRASASSPGNVTAKRDYALLQWYVSTGRRRGQVISLRGLDVRVRSTTRGGEAREVLVVRYRMKGGRYLTSELRDASVREALFDYLEASGRRDVLGSELPLWTRHDRAGRPGAPLTSHAFVKNLRRYAREAGLARARHPLPDQN